MAQFDAQQVAAEQGDDLEDFVFKGMDGEQYRLPNLKGVSARLAKRFSAGDETILGELDAEAYEAIQDMPLGVAEQLTLSWVEHSGMAGKERLRSLATQNGGKRSSGTSRSAGKRRTASRST